MNEVKTQINNFLTLASSEIAIKSREQDVQACELGKTINSELKRLEDLKKSLTDPLNQSLKNIRALFKPAEERGQEMLRAIKDAHNGFVAEQQRIAREHEEKLAEIARKKAEELKEQAKDEEFLGNDTSELLQEAMLAEIVPLVSADVEKVDNVVMKTYWSAEIIDINLVPREYLLPDMNKLNAMARTVKGDSDIPGVKFVSRQDASFGRM